MSHQIQMSTLARSPSVWRIGVGVLVGGIFISLLATTTSWSNAAKYVFHIQVFPLVLGTGLFMTGSLLLAVRWKLLLVAQNVSVLRLYIVQNTGLGADAFSPIRLLSIPVQLLMLTTRDQLHLSIAIRSVAAKRLMDVVLIGTIVVVSLIWQSSWTALLIVLPALAWSGLVWTGATAASFLTLFKGDNDKRPPSSWSAALPRMLVALSVATLGWLFMGSAAWIVAAGLSAPLPVFGAIAIGLATIAVAGAIPGLPAGIGTFEFAFVHLAATFGVDAPLALAIAVTFHVAIIAPAMVIAVWSLLREANSLGGAQELLVRLRGLRKAHA